MRLNSPLSEIIRILPRHQKALNKLGLKTVEDLLYHFPFKYGDISQTKNISDLVKGETVVVFGNISRLKTSKAFRKKIPMSDGVVTDETGHIKCVWFNQPYIAKMVHEGQYVRVEGKVSERKEVLYLSNPKIEHSVADVSMSYGNQSLFVSNPNNELHHLYPVYPESNGLTSNWIYHALQKIMSRLTLDTLVDPIPEKILKKYNLPSIKTALIWIHTPKKEADAQSARKRFAFEKIFFIQLQKQKEKKLWKQQSAFNIKINKKDIEQFVKRFPFKMTESQSRAIESIIEDLKRGHPMSRLLEGDVGSGKTAVAATIIYTITQTPPTGNSCGNLQTAYMAPTEILAKQHYENFISYFEHLPIKIGLLTGSECKIFPSKSEPTKSTKISRAQLLKWVENGEVPILIGTHSLIQKSVKFKHLAFVVIDEQHRFGTNQRGALASKDKIVPHLLSMTATPIPRTLALTIYGDLDLTLLDQMPHGRKPIITRVVLPNQRKDAYEHIRDELKAGRQLYVICPRIDEPDPAKEMAVIAKSVKMEAERLNAEVFPEYMIDILHSKMTPAEKEETMADFSSGKTRILVATSVVEVGVNVPNATMIVIEGAERFGLAQLHQLRGRVIRSNHQAYCFVFAESNGHPSSAKGYGGQGKTANRLKALTTAKNGFELAEFDLKQRGAGELYGKKQWGISDLAMEAIKNIKMVEASRTEAIRIVEEDENFDSYPMIKEYFDSQTNKIHFE